MIDLEAYAYPIDREEALRIVDELAEDGALDYQAAYILSRLVADPAALSSALAERKVKKSGDAH